MKTPENSSPINADFPLNYTHTPQKHEYNPRKKSSLTMNQTHCSLTSSSQIMGMEQQKIHTFKKIKLGYLNQKNNQGKILNKIVHFSRELTVPNIIEQLDDAVTIYSEQSIQNQDHDYDENQYQEQNHGGNLFCKARKDSSFRIDQSIIVMSSKDVHPDVLEALNNNSKYTSIQYILPKDEGNQRKSIKKQQLNKNRQLVNIKLLNQQTGLAIIQPVGMLANIQIIKKNQQNYKIITQNINNLNNIEGIIKIHQIILYKNIKITTKSSNVTSSLSLSLPLPSQSTHNDTYIILCQPYEQTLTQKLLKQQVIDYGWFIEVLSQIIKTLLQLSKINIFVQLDPSTVTVNHFNKVKIMMKNCYTKSSKFQYKNCVKNLGIYINTHFKILYQLSSTSSLFSSLPLPQISLPFSDKNTKILNKFKGSIDIIKRIQIKQFIDFLMRDSRSKNLINSQQNDEINFEIIYEKIKNLSK